MMNRDHATPEAARFWSECSRNRLCLQRCTSCQSRRYPPGPVCRNCGSLEADWEEVSGLARLLSFVVYRRDFGANLELPYIIALIQLREGPQMITRLVDCAPEGVTIGMSLELQFQAGPEGVQLPLFKPS